MSEIWSLIWRNVSYYKSQETADKNPKIFLFVQEREMDQSIPHGNYMFVKLESVNLNIYLDVPSGAWEVKEIELIAWKIPL